MSRLAPWMLRVPVLTDGAWGTELHKQGLEPGACADLWNLTRPEAVLAIARSYVEAGSRVILTNTFRANPLALAGYHAADRVGEINRAGVWLSLQAAGEDAAVFASLGPSGKLLAAGEVTEAAVEESFRCQAQACAEAGAAALLLETFSDLEEARLAVAAARGTGLPVLLSFAFDSGKNKDRTLTGATPEQAARLALETGADGIGANCGVGIAAAIPLCRRLKAAAPSLPVWIKPNAGLPVLEDGRAVYRVNADAFAAHLPELVAAGASFVGACCGSDPAFIRACREKLP